ncbi:MAG TPA: MarR family transcriptional regulator [Gemmatimonadaceae bacterium]
MPIDLRSEIKQGKPFESLEQEAHLNLERTTAVLGHALGDSLRRFRITPTQYNALRILRGAGSQGLSRNEVRDRLISQVPDVTRLLDRLEESGFAERERLTTDRRLVATRITDKGLAVLSELDAPVAAMHRRAFGHMSPDQLRTLIELLTIAREGGGVRCE